MRAGQRVLDPLGNVGFVVWRFAHLVTVAYAQPQWEGQMELDWAIADLRSA